MVKAYRPENLKEALKIISEEECTIFAGGTDLMVKHRQWSGLVPGFEKPVVFIGGLKELKGISKNQGYISIGSAATCFDILSSPILPAYIREPALSMASPAIRNAATIGGNICNSSPAGDMLPVLYALDAVLVLESRSEVREVSIQDFIEGPGRNIIKKQELLREIKVPDKAFDIYLIKKVGTRKANALSKLSFAGLAQLKGCSISDIRMAFGAVGPTVIRDTGIENKIANSWDYTEAEGEAELYRNVIKPIDDQRSTAFYRMEVCINTARLFIKSVFDEINRRG